MLFHISISLRHRISCCLMLLFFAFFPFIDHTGQISYLPFEVIGILFITEFYVNKQYSDTFIKYYMFVLFWALIVSILSVNSSRSFHSFRYWLIPLFVYITLANIDYQKIFKVYIWVPTIILLIENILLFLYWSKFSYLYSDYPILQHMLLFCGNWYTKIYTSTLILCMLIGIWFILYPSKNKIALVFINLISAFLSYDRAFWFSLLLIMLVYLGLEKLKLSLANLIKVFFLTIIVILLLSFIMYYCGMDLHIKERIVTYSYWLSVVHVSPLYGVGVGRDSLSYYVSNYPIPEYILQINPFTPFTSHNFFLDLLVTQGSVGVILFITLLYKINLCAIVDNSNVRYKYITLYMTLAVFSKFIVDNQFDNRKIFVFWFFILVGYLSSKDKSLVKL